MVLKHPPMGWNTWNTFGEDINEKLIMDTADIMAESGLLEAGYEYLVIDDCWAPEIPGRGRYGFLPVTNVQKMPFIDLHCNYS